MRWSRKLTAELGRLTIAEKAALADYLYLVIEKEAIAEGVRRIEDVATGKVKGIPLEKFLRKLK